MEKYDNIFIGFGQGPKVLANTFTSHGETVLSIEAESSRYGGTCFTEGCIPSKKLLFMSKKTPGQSPRENYRNAITEKEWTVETLRNVGYHMIADGGAKVINGVGSFIGNHQVRVTSPNGESKDYEGTRIIINTGSKPIMPNIDGLASNKRVFDSAGIMNLKELPDKLVIIGAGAIGLEFATIYNNFGSKVTLIENAQNFMPAATRAVADHVRANLEASGIRILTDAKVTDVKDTDRGADISINMQSGQVLNVTSDAVLVATGRKPDIDRLNLNNTDIKLTDGRIDFNDHLETSVPNVFVEGDVKGGPQFTSISLSDNRIITDYIYGDAKIGVESEQSVFPTTVFLNTPLSRIGMTSDEALHSGKHVGIGHLDAGDTLRSRITGDETGFMEVLVDLDSKLVIGATLYIDNAEEVINLIELVMREGLPYTSLMNMTYTHPVSSEMLFFLLNDLKELK
ncbi:FAD-dependent oxidoreductase [Weissella muntiaci]|nr:FAD-dependent oxidoreductase [Weissella muntiaci]